MSVFYMDFAEISDAIKGYENLIEKFESCNNTLVATASAVDVDIFAGADADLLRESWGIQSSDDIPYAIEKITSIKDALVEARTEFKECKKCCINFANAFDISTYMVHPTGMNGILKCDYDDASSSIGYCNNIIDECVDISDNLDGVKRKFSGFHGSYDDIYTMIDKFKTDSEKVCDVISTHKSDIDTYARMVSAADDNLTNKLRDIMGDELEDYIKYGANSINDSSEISKIEIDELISLQRTPEGVLPASELQRMKELETKLLASGLWARELYKNTIMGYDPNNITNTMRNTLSQVEGTISYGEVIDKRNQLGKLLIEENELNQKVANHEITVTEYCNRVESLREEISVLEKEIDDAILAELENDIHAEEFTRAYYQLDNINTSTLEKVEIYVHWQKIDGLEDITGQEMPVSWTKTHLVLPDGVVIDEDTYDEVFLSEENIRWYEQGYYIIELISGQPYAGLSADEFWEIDTADRNRYEPMNDLYKNFYDYSYGAIEDFSCGKETIRAVKYGMSKYYGFGDFSDDIGFYHVITNDDSTVYEFALEASLSYYGHADDYYTKILGTDVKINREEQFLYYIKEDKEKYYIDGVQCHLKMEDSEWELLKKEFNSTTYEEEGYIDYISIDRAAYELFYNMPGVGERTYEINGKQIIISFEGNTDLYTDVEIEEYKIVYDFSDAAEAYGGCYISLEDFQKEVERVAALQLDNGWISSFELQGYEDRIYYSEGFYLSPEELAEVSLEEREEQERAAKIALMTSDLVVDCYMDDRVRNVEVFNEVKDTFVAGINAATFFASMSNPVVGGIVCGGAFLANVGDGVINIMQGEEEKGIAEIAFAGFDGVGVAKELGFIPEGTIFNPLADDAVRVIDDIPVTNVTHVDDVVKEIPNSEVGEKVADAMEVAVPKKTNIDKVSLSDTGISTANIKNSSIKNANIENASIKKVNIKNNGIKEGVESQLEDIGEGSVKVSKLAPEKTPAEIVEVTTNNTPKIASEVKQKVQVITYADGRTAYIDIPSGSGDDLAKLVSQVDNNVDDFERTVVTLDKESDEFGRAISSIDDGTDDMGRTMSHVDDGANDYEWAASHTDEEVHGTAHTDEPTGNPKKINSTEAPNHKESNLGESTGKKIDADDVHKSDVDAAEGKSGNRENSKTDAERKNHNDSDNHKNQNDVEEHGQHGEDEFDGYDTDEDDWDFNLEDDINDGILYGDELTNSMNSEPLEVETSASDVISEGEKSSITKSEYSSLRKKTPNADIRKMVNPEGPKIDPVYGYETSVLEADHIVSMKKVVEMPGFSQLSAEQKEEVLNLKDNFIGLGKPTNASKGAKSWTEWRGHSVLGEVPDSVRKEMIEKERKAKLALQEAIKEGLENDGY